VFFHICHNCRTTLKKRDKQNLREDFIDLVKKDLNVDLELRDVVAIHCLPSDRPGEKPIIVRLFNSDAKRNVMSSYKPNLNCLSSGVLPYMPQL
jgi:hypothetical protein